MPISFNLGKLPLLVQTSNTVLLQSLFNNWWMAGKTQNILHKLCLVSCSQL
jgi:hypothetical protein